MGDVLVVTLTPDRFVNKGPGRPAFNEVLRAEAIAALDTVDYVAINEWPTAIETIKALKPDLYVKGPDYKKMDDDITGNIESEKNAIEYVGGQIAFTSAETFSSSRLINDFMQQDEEQKHFIRDLKGSCSYQDICNYVDELIDLQVLIIGEVIIDEYVFCNSVGKSGKEPVMVSQKIRTEKYAGGVLSVANNLSDYCRDIKIISYLGDRDNQIEFIDNCLRENVEFEHINKKDSPTILKTRFIDEYTGTKIQGIYDINDENINKDEENQLINILNDSINDFDLVLVVDYGHGLISSKIVSFLENKSKFLAINTQLNSFNASFHSISKYKKADYVCVHSRELRHDYRNRDDSEEKLMDQLYKKMGLTNLSITLGNKGSMMLKNGVYSECPAFAGKIVDRVGAGDTFLAITSLCVAKNMPEHVSLFLGNLSAAESVASMGTGNISKKINLLKSVKALFS